MIADLKDVPRHIERLALEGRTCGRSWTLAQITDHLARSMEWTVRAPAARSVRPRGARRWLRWVSREVTLLTGWIPRGLPTSDALNPSPEVPLDDSIMRLRAAIERLESWTSEPPAHPILGPMSRGRWIRFHLIHARHHLRTVG